MNITFPVFVLLKDCGEVVKCNSVYEMQRRFEKIDIENDEYRAWDAAGHPVVMRVQKPVWLMLNAEDRNELDHLRKVLVTFADSAKVDLNPVDANNSSPEQIFETIAHKLEKQQRS